MVVCVFVSVIVIFMPALCELWAWSRQHRVVERTRQEAHRELHEVLRQAVEDVNNSS